LTEATKPIHELEPAVADLPAHDHPRLVGLDKPPPKEPNGPGYWATIHDQRVWVQICPPRPANGSQVLSELRPDPAAGRYEARTRFDETPHLGGHEHPEGYEEADVAELQSQVSSTRSSWASGWNRQSE